MTILPTAPAEGQTRQDQIRQDLHPIENQAPGAGPLLQVGATCHVGKGRTLWEVVKVHDASHTVELSALGRHGYVNKTVNADEVNSVTARRLTVSLGEVLAARQTVRGYAATLNDRARFNDIKEIADLGTKAHRAALVYTSSLEQHLAGLADLGIKEG